MSYQPPRSPHLQMMGGAALSSGRSAALLIDFDNVTMNVRSDLGKELKTLLDSEMFRGKIAVRRAYADWRRYPASVVPLTEASVDLIFAPAYGTSKKNATDLRMAVDAIELAFMRPEIGVFILLTGDSDFSSCVMKLKEYGKYVIGVGMRESASDLLIQNCDEYYSYHNLSGLTRATEDTGVREDPWALVAKAAQTMARRGDVMRVDRLKQVMIELDPGFSEKDIGYSKFSKFIQEAKDRGMLRLRRTDGGEWEVAPSEREEAPASEEPQYSADRPERLERGERWRDRDRGRGRGGRDRFRGRDRDRDRPRYPEPVSAGEPPFDVESELEARSLEAPAAPPVFAEPEVEAAAPSAPPAEAPAPVAEASPSTSTSTSAGPAAPVDPLQNAFALLQHTVRQMVRRPGETARDGDVKRRMLEAQPGFDEHAFGFSKFSRFLREAHERQVVDVRRQDDGGYEVLLPSSGGIRLPAPVLTAGAASTASTASTESAAPSSESATPAQDTAPAAPRGGRGGRGRGRRGEPAGAPPLIPGQVVGGTAEAQPVAETPVVEAREPELTPAQALQERQDGDELVRHREPAVATARIEDPASIANRGSSTSAGSVGLRGRGGRGRRGGEPSGPPPLLPGQVVSVGGARAAEPAAETPSVEAEAPAETPAAETRGGRSRRGRGREAASASTETPSAEVVEAVETPAAPAAGIDAARLGLPTDRDGIVQRVSSYNFVGRATGEALVDAYGENVWRTLDESPDAVRELLGARKARPLLEQWAAERDQLIANAPAPAEPEAPAEPVAEAPLPVEATEGDTEAAADAAEATRGRSRGRRGRGRGRTSGDETSSAQADAVIGDTDPSLVGAAGTGDVPVGDDQPSAAAQAEEVLGDTDPTLVGDLDGEAEAAPRGRSRSRRGGRGRSRGGRGDAAEDAAPAEAAAPEPAPAPEPVAEAAPAEERPSGRGRGRGRGRGGQAAEAAAPAEAPAPAPEPAAEAAPAAEDRPAGRGRSRGGRGRGAAADAAEAAPAVTPETAPGGRARSRRGGNAAAAEAAPPAAPAPAPAEAASAEEGGGRSRSRRRGGRGRGRGRTGGTPGEG